jgi:EpsI family protein
MTMEKEFLDVLKFDDYLMVDYKDPQGRTVSFYTAYYSSQTKGESIHSPETCLPSGGWLFEESGDVTFPLKNGAGTMRVNRAYMQKGGVRELTYYWFPQRGRIVTNLFQLKLYTFWNALTSRRTDGALVRVITPVYESERLTDAEARLQGFTREMTPVLATFLPQ